MSDRAKLRSEAESDEYTHVYYVADAPRKRDWLRVLLGKHTPTVRRIEQLTFKGTDRVLRQAWTPEAIKAQFYTDPLLDDVAKREAA